MLRCACATREFLIYIWRELNDATSSEEDALWYTTRGILKQWVIVVKSIRGAMGVRKLYERFLYTFDTRVNIGRLSRVMVVGSQYSIVVIKYSSTLSLLLTFLTATPSLFFLSSLTLPLSLYSFPVTNLSLSLSLFTPFHFLFMCVYCREPSINTFLSSFFTLRVRVCICTSVIHEKNHWITCTNQIVTV